MDMAVCEQEGGSMKSILITALIGVSGYLISRLAKGEKLNEQPHKPCGYNAESPGACRRTATLTLPYQFPDGRAGKVYLCGYHAGALIMQVMQEDEKERKDS